MLIIELLTERQGSYAKLARQLGYRSNGVTTNLKEGIKKESTQKRYTKAFNECFGTNYTFNELFDE